MKVEVETTDRYGRIVGWLIRLKDNLNVNQQMVRDGHAWVYTNILEAVLRAYEKDEKKISEDSGRSSPISESPWDWRKMKRSGGGKRAGKIPATADPRRAVRR